MNDADWKNLTQRFPRVPAALSMQEVRRAAPPEKVVHDRPVIALAFSPDGRSIALSGGGLLPGAADVRLLDIGTRTITRVARGHTHGVFELAFDPRSGLLASVSHDYSALLWDFGRNDAVVVACQDDEVVSRRATAFLGAKLLVADGMTFEGERATLSAFDLETGARDRWIELEGDLGISNLSVLASAELVIATVEPSRSPGDPEVRVLDLRGREQRRFRVPSYVYELHIADPSVLIATGMDAEDATEVFTIDARDGRSLVRRRLGKHIGAKVAVSPTRDRVAIAYQNGVERCRLDTLEPDLRIDLGAETMSAVEWSSDGRWLAVGTVQKTLRLFDAESGREHRG